MTVRLHVNVDHVATLRQARGTPYPDPVAAAALCEKAGAHGITVHLREDRRHIQDHDVERLRGEVTTLLNLEMAATDEMVTIASRVVPDLVTLVPEKREEQTTEGGLDAVGNREVVGDAIARLKEAGVPVSLFIDPEPAQIAAARDLGAKAVELHTGDYANAKGEATAVELSRLQVAARWAKTDAPELTVAAGHGLTVANTEPLVSAIPEVVELNIGHALVSDAVLDGLAAAVRAFIAAIGRGRGARPGGAS